MKQLVRFLALVALLSIAAAPQTEPIRVTTRIVQVDVVAHDKSGTPVRDLTKDDFVLYDNGKPQPISTFSLDAADAPAPASAKPLAPNVFSNHLARQTTARGNLSILLLDGMNTQPIDQARSLPHIVRYLETLHPEDHVAIYTFGLGGLRILQDFTTDSARLKKALDAYRLRETALRDQPVEPTEAAQPGSFEAFAQNSAAKLEQADLKRRVLLTLDAIAAVANHVAGVPGRKSLVWVSSAFPFSFGLEEANEAGLIAPDLDRGTFNTEVTRAMLAVNRANLAIYPIDARGLIGSPLGNVEMRRFARNAPVNPSNNEINSMAILADRTGGRAFYNNNNIEAGIRQAVDDTRVTYTLGYYPPAESLDGKFHELKVEVKRKGVDIRSRRGYFASADNPLSADQLKTEVATAVSGPLDASNIRLTASLFRIDETPGSRTLRVELEVQPSDITLDQNGDHWTGGLHLVFVQLASSGHTLDSLNDVIRLNLDRRQYENLGADGVTFAKDVTFKQGIDQLRIVVVDRPTGKVGSLRIPVGGPAR